MDSLSYMILAASVVIVALFLTLFLQGAYVRHRLQDLEEKTLGSSDAACPPCKTANAMRSYALRVAACKMRDMNLSQRLPYIPDDIEVSLGCVGTDGKDVTDVSVTYSKESSAFWLVLRRTPSALQLKEDVDAGRVKYVIAAGHLIRVASVEMQAFFGDNEKQVVERDHIFLAIADPFQGIRASQGSNNNASATCANIMPVEVVLPWAASYNNVGRVDAFSKYIASLCNNSSSNNTANNDTNPTTQTTTQTTTTTTTTDGPDVVLHVWGYGFK
jgi:hypothetical protein